MREHLARCAIICLDHDLGPSRTRDGAEFDPGTGRDVADFLATYDPVCPVNIHTTNTLASPGMEMSLRDAGWSCSRVIPYGDTAWIAEWWIEEVENAMR